MLSQMARLYSFLMANIHVYLCIYVTSFIHSSINRHSGCFHILTIVNNAAMNIGMHISFLFSKNNNQHLLTVYYVPGTAINILCKKLCNFLLWEILNLRNKEKIIMDKQQDPPV